MKHLLINCLCSDCPDDFVDKIKNLPEHHFEELLRFAVEQKVFPNFFQKTINKLPYRLKHLMFPLYSQHKKRIDDQLEGLRIFSQAVANEKMRFSLIKGISFAFLLHGDVYARQCKIGRAHV